MTPESLIQLLSEVRRVRDSLIFALSPVDWLDTVVHVKWPEFGEDSLTVSFVEDPSCEPNVTIESESGQVLFSGPLDTVDLLISRSEAFLAGR